MNTDSITKRFYQRFQMERLAFLATLHGLSSVAERERYTTFLLTRLLFLYFLQQHSLLDNDTRYLFHHLEHAQKHNTNFYQTFLVPLFEDGLSSLTPPISHSLFGTIPALDPHLFKDPLSHACEITIPNDAFARLFAFLDSYTWSLSDSLPQHQREMTPAILGHILEQHTNQPQAAAYYTKDDVTTYIASNTILPALFDALQRINPGIQIGFDVDELITDNADLPAITLHFVETCSQDILPSFYTCLRQLTILDPTCGSGAFLLAALHVLEPLYTACLTRLHLPCERAATLRAIIAHNLYGVDLLPEATTSCCLRLLLCSLVPVQQTNAIQPLPALHTNIRVGNALIGYTKSYNGSQLDYDYRLASEYGLDTRNHEVCERWRASHSPFHWPLAFPLVMQRGGFDVIIGNPPYVEYEERIFPYRVQGYDTQACANLYPYVIERSYELLAPGGRHGMIVPLSAFATRNMIPFIEGFLRWFAHTWVSFYHFRPAMLFSGNKVASIPTAIYLAHKICYDGSSMNSDTNDKTGETQLTESTNKCYGYKKYEGEQRFSTHIHKWLVSQRPHLFSSLTYTRVTVPRDPDNRHYYPKFGSILENSILEKVLAHRLVRDYLSPRQNANSMWYRSAGGLYWKVFVNFPWPYTVKTNKRCSFRESFDRDVFVALFNSSLFWWYYTVTFDTFNLKDYMLFGFRFTYPADSAVVNELKACCQRLMDDYQQHARHLKRGQTDSYTIYAKQSKHILDEIDGVLARHYGFLEEEFMFIREYDIAYRVGTSKSK